MARRILRLVRLDIYPPHSHGVIHGDIHKGKIFFQAPCLDSCTAEEFEVDANAGMMSVSRLMEDLTNGHTLIWPCPMIEYPHHGPVFTIIITDVKVS